MKILFEVVLALALLVTAASAQGESSLIWSTFSTGYQASVGDSSSVEGIAGQVFAGSTSGDSAGVGGGFFFGFSATSTTSLVSLKAGWNLISVPLSVSSYDKSALFPSAISNAFAYEGSYISKTTLTNGVGYWLKSGADQDITIGGFSRPMDTVAVKQGW